MKRNVMIHQRPLPRMTYHYSYHLSLHTNSVNKRVPAPRSPSAVNMGSISSSKSKFRILSCLIYWSPVLSFRRWRLRYSQLVFAVLSSQSGGSDSILLRNSFSATSRLKRLPFFLLTWYVLLSKPSFVLQLYLASLYHRAGDYIALLPRYSPWPR